MRGEQAARSVGQPEPNELGAAGSTGAVFFDGHGERASLPPATPP